MQGHLGTNLRQTLHRKVRCAHSHLERREWMLCRLASLAHCLRILVETFFTQPGSKPVEFGASGDWHYVRKAPIADVSVSLHDPVLCTQATAVGHPILVKGQTLAAFRPRPFDTSSCE